MGGDNSDSPVGSDNIIDENSSQVVDDTNNTVEVDGTKSLSFVGGAFSFDVTKNAEVTTIKVLAFAEDNSPLQEGTVNIAYPAKSRTGVDIGSFTSISQTIENGQATFTYTAPADLQERVDAGDTSTVFGFYLDDEPSILEYFTFNYAPEANQIVLTDYELKQNLSSEEFSMNLNSSLQTSFYVEDTTGNKVLDTNMNSITVTLNDKSLATLIDTYNNTGEELIFNNKNNVSLNIKSSTKSGTLPITVVADFTDVNGDNKVLTKVFNLTIFSGPPTSMSISYVSTDQDENNAKFIEKMNVALTDTYNNLVNTNPSFSASVISGYAYDRTGPLGYMYQRADSPIAGKLTQDNKFIVPNNKIAKVNMLSSGSGYVYPPTVSIAGGNGDFNAKSVLKTTGSIADVQVISAGTGYTEEPSVEAEGEGYGFVAKANLTTVGSFESINLDDGGQDYTTPPTIVPNDVNGSGFSAQVILEQIGQIKSVDIDNGGSNYIAGDELTVNGDGSGAIVKVKTVDASGAITGLYIASKGKDYSYANIDFFSGSGTGAEFTVEIGKKIASIELLNGGSGYTDNTLRVAGDGSKASVSGKLSYGIDSIDIISGGYGYKSPIISLDGDGKDAYAVAEVRYGVDYVTITNGGTGYNDSIVSFTSIDGRGSGASALGIVFNSDDLAATDEDNFEIALFGNGYVYNASGYFDFSHLNTNNDYELSIDNTYEGNETSGLGFAIGNNHRQDPCISGKEWTSRVEFADGTQFDDLGFARLDVYYDYYMVAKDIILMVNLVGQQNDLNTENRFGEAVKHTLRGHGINAPSVSFPKGTSYGKARVYVWLDDTAEPLRNARFTYDLKVSGNGAIVHSIEESTDSGILECGVVDNEGTKGEGRAYIDVVVSAPLEDVTVVFDNIEIVREFN